MASDAESRKLKQDIIECLEKQKHLLCKEQIKDKDVIVFLGNTKSGKSTLVNYIIGAKLEAFFKSTEMKYKIREVEADQGPSEREVVHGPSIGQDSLSCTTLPGVYSMRKNDGVVAVDLPGFDDNRGVVQNIINALCISQIKFAKTVRFILVSDISDIALDNVRNFTYSLQQVQSLVCNFEKVKRSFAVVFTKASGNYTQSNIAGLFRSKILNVDKLDVNKVLLKNLADNEKLIGIFKVPTQEGNISSKLDVNIEGAIAACDKVGMERCQIMFALSDKTQEALLQIYPEYTNPNFFEDEINRLIAKYNKYFDVDKYVFASFERELEDVRTVMDETSSALEMQRDATRTHLHEIQASLDKLLSNSVSSEFRANFKFVVMLDRLSLLGEKYKQDILKNYARSLSKLFDKTISLLKKIENEQDERHSDVLKFDGSLCVAAAGAQMMAVAAASSEPFTVPIVGQTATRVLSFIGPPVLSLGVGAAAALYFIDQQTNGKRKEARRQQNRD